MTEEFKFEICPRQGDALSPFVFLTSVKGLKVIMIATITTCVFTSYNIGSTNKVVISHL